MCVWPAERPQAASCSSSRLIIHTVVGGDTGDGVHVVFDGTDRLAAFVDSFPLKIKKHKDRKILFKQTPSEGVEKKCQVWPEGGAKRQKQLPKATLRTVRQQST